MMARAQSLQVRFLASLILSVAAALATVAIMARWSTTMQFEQYVQRNRDDMQQVATQLAVAFWKLQMSPQAPQLFGSVLTVVQKPLQLV